MTYLKNKWSIQCPINTQITVTVSNSAYVINGSSIPNGTINLLRGYTYQINVLAPNHPFVVKKSDNNVYSDGIGIIAGNTTPTIGITSGTITIVVSASTPSLLYYICTTHGFITMKGFITIT